MVGDEKVRIITYSEGTFFMLIASHTFLTRFWLFTWLSFPETAFPLSLGDRNEFHCILRSIAITASRKPIFHKKCEANRK